MKLTEMFPSPWLSVVDIDHPVTVNIGKVLMEEMRGPEGKVTKPVVYFVRHRKGLILNKTNGTAIGDLYGNDTDDWEGKPVELYPTVEPAFGRDWDVVRIRAPKTGTQTAPKSADTTGSAPAEVLADFNAEVAKLLPGDELVRDLAVASAATKLWDDKYEGLDTLSTGDLRQLLEKIKANAQAAGE